MYDMRIKKFEFETNEGYLADQFLQILEVFRLTPEDVYIPSFLDYSDIEFRTTPERRKQIEYVFWQYLKKTHKRKTSSIVELEGGEWYAIF